VTDTLGLSLIVEQTGDDAVVRVAGEIDLATARRVRQAATDAVRPGGRVAVDMSAVTFCDSSGLGALVWSYQYAAKHDCTFAIRDPHPRVLKVIRLSGLDELIPIESTT
jgi:anti-anti-sigma factor